jgi:SNF2 family DNA or RNA helicase
MGLAFVPSQREGLGFLWQLHESEFGGGILADDMGLGKTVQACAFISGLFYSGLCAKVLILAPVSVIPTWCESHISRALVQNKSLH